MLKIRLQRVGKKNQPSYRVVLVEHTAPPQGKFQEIIGHYNPRKKEKSFNKERIEHWLSKGVQLSPTVYNLLVDEKILDGPKLKAWKPKKKTKKEAPKEAEALKEEVKPTEEKVEEKKVEEAPKEEKPKEERPEAKEEVKEKAKKPEKPREEKKPEEKKELEPEKKPKNK